MDGQFSDQRLYERLAAICKTFSSPWRIRIVEELADGEQPVSYLVDRLGIPKSNVSQHLSLMREKSVVEFRREDGFVYYRLTNPKLLEACRLMRAVMIEQFESDGALAQSSRGLS